jgi:hypothetical protein
MEMRDERNLGEFSTEVALEQRVSVKPTACKREGTAKSACFARFDDLAKGPRGGWKILQGGWRIYLLWKS